MYALDTNTLIYFFKGKGRVVDRLLATSPANVAIPAVVAYEIETGIAKSTNPDRLRNQFDGLLSVVRLLPFAANEARHVARVRAYLENAGTPIGPLDTLIAGTALANGLALVTHNTKEFNRVPGLQLEDWF